eukprot:CCRYP_020451-RA/>CCRYP_020451-RA protein AED:0.41 eAED:0.72 QI:0/0/0/1/0/0/2/0/90
MEGVIFGLHYSGTTGTAVSTCQCPDNVKKLDNTSNTPSRTNHNINHIPLCASADTSPTLGKQQKTLVQEVKGVCLYYARAVDCTMLTALG